MLPDRRRGGRVGGAGGGEEDRRRHRRGPELLFVNAVLGPLACRPEAEAAAVGDILKTRGKRTIIDTTGRTVAAEGPLKPEAAVAHHVVPEHRAVNREPRGPRLPLLCFPFVAP